MHVRSLLVATLLCQLVAPVAPRPGHAAVVSGFQDTAIASVSQPSVLAFAPDGRLFIGEKASGRIRVYKAGALLTQPFLNLSDFVPAGTYFESFSERGLLGIAFDPSFGANGFVYVYYSICKTPGNPPQPGSNTCVTARNRVARVRASGDVVDPTTHVVILDDIESDAGNHNAGWIGVGPLDGKLYVATGDGGSYSEKAQNLGSLNGKVLRINGDGSIPSDNPFVGQPGARGEVWAYGFRNPFRCRFASDGRHFCGDVGNGQWEELDAVTRGANYGWPTTEGPFNPSSHPQLTAPIHPYFHTNNMSAAIVAGDFGAETSFPGDYQQSFFFADFAVGRIQRARLAASGVAVQSVDDFVTGIGSNSVTDVVAGPDGSLYYTVYGAGQVRRVSVSTSNRSPVAAASANVTTGPAPLTVQFSSGGSSDPDGDAVAYSWDFGDGSAASSLANPSHQYPAAGTYGATLTVSDGQADPGPGTDTITITVGGAPSVTITAPVDGATFRAGDSIVLAGSATDPEEGAVPASRLHWKVLFHHADHIHPYIDDLPGETPVFETATSGEPDADVGYEIILTATDAVGLTGTASVVIVPVTSDLTLQTNPPGLEVTLDGQPKTAPHSVAGVVGLQRSIGTEPMQTLGAQTYFFTGWSNAAAPHHEITTPELDTTLTASFMPPATCTAPLVIPAAGGTFTSTTGGTSNQAGTCAVSGAAGEQVFQWTPSAAGTAAVETCGGATSFDTVLYVRTGACGGGTQLACVDDATGCETTEPNDHHASRASVTVAAGQTYFIVVDGYGGARGTFTLTVTPPNGPAPTATAAPTATRTATAVPTATRTATPVLTPTRTATASPAAPTASRTATPLQTATPQPTATTTPVASPGACNPTVVPAEGGSFTGTTSGASSFTGTCAATGTAPDRVFQWTPAISGSAVIATCGGTTSFDTALYVRSGSCAGPQVSCNDDTAGCSNSEPNDHHASRVTTTVTAGQTYFIVVDGYNGTSGTFTLTITPPLGSSPTATRTASPTATPARTATAIATATATASVTPAPTTTRTATPIPSATGTAIATATAIPTATTTPIRTATQTAGASRTPTPAATATALPDSCGNVTVVPAEGGTFDGVTAGAGTEVGTCGVSDKGGERVFQWTPAVSGPATIGTCGAGTLFDTVVYLRNGSCSGGELVCIDDVTGCTTGEPSNHHGSRIAAVVTAGQTYFIVVDGYNGAVGAFSLTIDPPAGASPSPALTPTATLTVASTPTAAATATVTRTATPVPTVTNVPTLLPTRTATPQPTATATRTASPQPTAVVTPAGDACANPTVLPPAGGTFTDATSGQDSQAGTCALTNKAPERVFQWTPTASGTATFSTCSDATQFDTVVYLRGDACGGPELACNDDTTGCATGTSTYHGSRLTRTVSAGVTYFIVVDGYDMGAGSFVLNVTAPNLPTPTTTRTATPQATQPPAATAAPTVAPSPAPGECGATIVPAAGGTITGTTTGSSLYRGSCGRTDKGPEAVVQWTPSTSGQATVATCGTATDFDTVLYLRKASCGGTERGCNDDTPGCGTGEPSGYHGSRLTPTVTAGETYFIFVDGYEGSAGAFSLTITPPP